MAHPFSKMFEKVLKKSSLEDNLVLEKAEELRKKGYNVHEIHAVLTKLHKSLIDDCESAIVEQAQDDFAEKYIEADD